jgi:hypothetical protein
LGKEFERLSESGRFCGASRLRKSYALPDDRQCESRQNQKNCNEDGVELDESVLEIGDQCGWRERRHTLPESALHGCEEVDDPGPDGDAEREDRRRGRMFG